MLRSFLPHFSCLFAALPSVGTAQLPSAAGRPTPLVTPKPGPLGFSANPQPPRQVPLVEKKLEQLSEQRLSEDGRKALAIKPENWKHAETDNFIVHYRRATEAQKVVREVEYDLWFVATTLGATRDRYSKKSHVYVFQDEDEWKQFLDISGNPLKWAASYAHGDELFLNVRGGGNSGAGESFDSHTLAHETTHAVVARLFPQKRWPLWLNEGFAEYMGGASVAARKGQPGKRFERKLASAEMPLAALEALDAYPRDPASIAQLYATSEKLVRFLMTELPKDRIAKFIEAVLAGRKLQEAVVETLRRQAQGLERLHETLRTLRPLMPAPAKSKASGADGGSGDCRVRRIGGETCGPIARNAPGPGWRRGFRNGSDRRLRGQCGSSRHAHAPDDRGAAHFPVFRWRKAGLAQERELSG